LVQQFDGHGDQQLRGAALAPGLDGWILVVSQRHVDFVDFEHSLELIPAGVNRRATEPVQHRPGDLVAAQAEHALQAQGVDACFWLV
jgi:hypothetical protein